MITQEIREADKSETIIALNKSKKYQLYITLGVGAVAGSFMLLSIVNPDLHGRLMNVSVPVLGAALVAMQRVNKIFNDEAIAKRLNVGDLFTPIGEAGPSKGDIVAKALLTAVDLAQIKENSEKAAKYDADLLTATKIMADNVSATSVISEMMPESKRHGLRGKSFQSSEVSDYDRIFDSLSFSKKTGEGGLITGTLNDVNISEDEEKII